MLEEYLATLPEPVITRLFQSPASCLALLRLLPPLAKAVVMRLLFATEATPLARLEQFVKQRKPRVEAVQKLRSLKIVRERFTTNSLEINSVFQRSLQTALTSGLANESFEESGSPLAPAFLRDFQRVRWETMLHFMVSSASEMADPAGSALVPAAHAARRGERAGLSPAIMALLVKSGLLNRQHNITSDGFQFLLQDQQSQIWTLLLHYLNNASELDMDPVDILNFLFRLGMLEMGRGHAVRDLSAPQQRILAELAELGIVYVERNVFYAAIELTNMEAAPDVEAAPGFIIVETNYRLYAYTNSPLQISILNLFCSLKSRFANLVIGRFTRHSARRALANGIRAEQIIQYLTKNQRGGGALPPTIVDQIKLWQLELDRFRQAPGFLFRDFVSAAQYAAAVQFAQDVGALLWNNERARMFFVDDRSGRVVSEFVNRSAKA